MMTDAISNWYLKAVTDDQIICKQFLGFVKNNDKKSIEALIKSERTQKTLRNDDIAIVCIYLEG